MTKKDPLKTLHEIWSQLTPQQRKWLRIQGEVFYTVAIITNFLSRIDLWLFPPLAFITTYFATTNQFPAHPIKMYVVLSCAFMFATLTLFLIRPKRRKVFHWVKNVE